MKATTTTTLKGLKRLDSSLESKGAEYLVLGNLLVERITSYIAYDRNMGHDILACDPANGKSCRVEVKSRWYSDGSKKVQFKSWDFDFAVIVLLHRGTKAGPHLNAPLPQFYVVPRDEVRSHNRGEGKLGIRFQLTDLVNRDEYEGSWHLIRNALAS